MLTTGQDIRISSIRSYLNTDTYSLVKRHVNEPHDAMKLVPLGVFMSLPSPHQHDIILHFVLAVCSGKIFLVYTFGLSVNFIFEIISANGL